MEMVEEVELNKISEREGFFDVENRNDSKSSNGMSRRRMRMMMISCGRCCDN